MSLSIRVEKIFVTLENWWWSCLSGVLLSFFYGLKKQTFVGVTVHCACSTHCIRWFTMRGYISLIEAATQVSSNGLWMHACMISRSTWHLPIKSCPTDSKQNIIVIVIYYDRNNTKTNCDALLWRNGPFTMKMNWNSAQSLDALHSATTRRTILWFEFSLVRRNTPP